MADSSYNIKKVRLSDGDHYIDAKYLDGHSYDDIIDKISKAFEVEVVETLPTISTEAQYNANKDKMFLIADNDKTSGVYLEYIAYKDTTSATTTYGLERIGTTKTDLTNYVQKNVTYTNAAVAVSGHTHKYTVPTVTVDKTMHLATSRTTDVAVGAATNGTKQVIKSYPGATSKLVTTSVTGVSGSTTASKATAGTDVTLAKRASSQTTVGNANVGSAVTVATKAATATKVGNADVGTAVSIPNVTGNTSVTTTFVNTPQTTTITEVTSKTNGSAASWSASVSTDGNGILSFNWTANTPTSITTADVSNVIRSNASTGTLVENRTSSNTTLGNVISVTPAKAVGNDSTTIYGCGNNTTVTPAVASTTKIYGVGDTETITPYTFEDITVPVAANAATTVATGALNANGGGASVMTGLGTAEKETVLSAVTVTTQPTFSVTEATTGTGPINEHTTTSSSTVDTQSGGGHSHDINVSS